jgi:hypothetical protein
VVQGQQRRWNNWAQPDGSGRAQHQQFSTRESSGRNVKENGAADGGGAAGRFHSSTGCFPVFTGTPEDEGSTGGD